MLENEREEHILEVIQGMFEGTLSEEELLAVALELKDENLSGLSAALPRIEQNFLKDEALIRLVVEHGIAFSDFQQSNLFHADGYFNNHVDFRENMTLCPQFAAPVFGRAFGDVAYSAYVCSS